ncbi:MAG TPA: hypothetical protein VLF93_01980 [Candidatus Saccharimonadales bacterium]|nr:hypothetical protein [Candidatus Saccharimonadales bacterium]
MRITRASSFILGLYVTLVIFWLSSSFFVGSNAHMNSHASFSTILNGFKGSTIYGYIFALVEGLIPFIASFLGFRKAQHWGLFKSTMGMAVFLFSLGLFCWGLGELIWSYYNFFLDANVPYPSWADAGFIMSYPIWGAAIFILGRATGAKFGLRKMGGKILLVAVPIAIFVVSWYLLVQIARGGSITSGGGPLKVFFDFAYPSFDVIMLTMAFLIYGLSFQYLGGRFKWPVVITLFGFFIEYFADFGFSYTTTVGTYYNGCLVDLLFATGMFILSFGITSLDIKDD